MTLQKQKEQMKRNGRFSSVYAMKLVQGLNNSLKQVNKLIIRILTTQVVLLLLKIIFREHELVLS